MNTAGSSRLSSLAARHISLTIWLYDRIARATGGVLATLSVSPSRNSDILLLCAVWSLHTRIHKRSTPDSYLATTQGAPSIYARVLYICHPISPQWPRRQKHFTFSMAIPSSFSCCSTCSTPRKLSKFPHARKRK